jgi:secreted trypsin-like serine protease
VLVGVTSNGIGCAEAAYSGLYTRVAAYQSWISTNINGAVSAVTILASTTISTSTTQFASTTVLFSTSASASTTVTASTTISASKTVPASTSVSVATSVSAPTTTLTSAAASYFSSSIQPIQLHATIVEMSIYNGFVFLLLDFLVAP